MQKVLSSRSRMERVVEDIVFDFGVKPRLVSERGNAMLVASSIYEACRYFELFEKTPLPRPLRGRDVLRPEGPGRDEGGHRGEHRDGEAVPLQDLHRAARRTSCRRRARRSTETYEDDGQGEVRRGSRPRCGC